MARLTAEQQLAKLKKQQEALDAKIKALLNKSNQQVIAKIVALAKDAGVTAADIAAAMGKTKAASKTKAAQKATKTSDKRAKVAPKYRNPSDANQTWTGRGRTPVWVQALKEAGKLDNAKIV
jgi:DNA-binding protein H-NS